MSETSSDHEVVNKEDDDITIRSRSTSTSFVKDAVPPYYCYGSLGKDIHQHDDSVATTKRMQERSDEYFIPMIVADHSDCSYTAAASTTKNSSSDKPSSSDMVLRVERRSVSPWIWKMEQKAAGERPFDGDDQEKTFLLEQYKHYGNWVSVSTTSDEESHLLLERRHDPLEISISGFFLSKVLGFQCNPFVNSHGRYAGAVISSRNTTRNSPVADLRLSMLSTLSTSYNTLSISWAVQIMSRIYPINEGEQSICSTALLGGMIFGQLFGGALGDYIGRHQAMTIVMLTQIFAALASALCFDREHNDSFYLNCFGYQFDYPENLTIFKMLAIWRFILGIGCGGAYPLSATLTAESTSCPQDRGKLVALTFSMQGIGYLIVPLFCWALIGIFGEVSDLTWRIMLGSGSVFGMILILLRTNSRRRRRREGQDQKVWKSKGATSTTTAATMDSVSSFSEENRNGEKKQREIASTPTHRIMMIGHDDKAEKQDTLQQQQETKPSIIEAIRTEQSLTRKLIGTAGCWFLFDVLFYGNTLFQPVVLHSVFGSQETLLDTARDSSIMAILALPGYFISIACIGRQSPRYIQLQGFLCMALLYSIIGYNFASLSKSRTVLLVLYGSTFFFSDYGPNTTTFMLPSMTFSPHCRSTLNGISAACGKLGAMLGASLFEPTAAYFGNNVVLLICSGLSILGAVMTWVGVTPNVGLGTTSTIITTTPSSAVRIGDSTTTKSSDTHNHDDANHDMPTVRIKFATSNRNKSAPSFLDYDG